MPPRLGRVDVVVLAILGLVGVGIPLWLAAAAGAIGIPGNDGSVYMRAAETLFRTGSLDMPGHTAASIGQVITVQPFLWLSGGDPWAFSAYGLVAVLIGVVASYLLARRYVNAGAATIVVLLVVAFPGLIREATSFMTDVPALALIVLCLVLGVAWLQGDGRRVTLVASMLVGVMAFSFREFAITAPVAILVAGWVRNRPADRAALAFATALFLLGIAAALGIAASIPGRGLLPAAPDLGRLVLNVPAFITFSAVVLPAIVLGQGQRMADLKPGQVILAVGLVGVAMVVVAPNGPLVGNLWLKSGLGGDDLLVGARGPVFGDRAWGLSEQLAVFAGILLAALGFYWAERSLARARSLSAAMGIAIRIARSPEAPLLLFAVSYTAALLVFATLSAILDRYLFPLVPVVAILLMMGRPEAVGFGRRHALAHLSLMWLVISAFAIAANSFAYDVARWRAGEEAVLAGYQADEVDAGYEWVVYHSVLSGSPRTPHGFRWYDEWIAGSRPCAVVSNDRLDLDGFTLIGVDRSAYQLYLFVGDAEPLYLYGADAVGCQPTAATRSKVVP